MTENALAGVDQWVGGFPTNWKIAGLIHGQGTGQGCRARSPVGGVQEAAAQCSSYTSMFLSLSFSLPSPLSKNK